MQPILGLLVCGAADEDGSDQYPRVSLEVDRKMPGRYRLVFDLGPLEMRRVARTGRALNHPSKRSVGVEVVSHGSGEKRLVVRDARMLKPFRDHISGRFDEPGQAPLALELIVLAVAGQDTRGLDGQIRFINGNPLNCSQSNLVMADDAVSIARRLDDLAPLVFMPNGNDREDFKSYIVAVLAILKPRYHRITSKVQLSQVVASTQQENDKSSTVTEEEARKPHFVAEVTIAGRDHRGRIVDKYRARVQAGSAYDAWFFGEMEALRRLMFFGYHVAYCGTLLKKGRLAVELMPNDLLAGTYRVIVTFDRQTRRSRWEPRQVRLPREHYEMEASIEREEDGLTPFLVVTGIHEDIKKAYGKFLDFSKTVRLHRLVLALDEVSLLDPKGDLTFLEEVWEAIAPDVESGTRIHLKTTKEPDHQVSAEACMVPPTRTPKPYPADDSKFYHGHHLFGIRHWNHRNQLARKTERRHQATHTEWRETLNREDEVKPNRYMANKGIARLIREIAPRLLGDEKEVELHLSIDARLEHHRRPNGRRKWSRNEKRMIDSIHGMSARIDGQQTISRMLRSIQEAGNVIAKPVLIEKSLVTPSRARIWLSKLIQDGLITVDKGDFVRISLEVPAPFPIPRKQDGSRRAQQDASGQPSKPTKA